MYTVSRAAKLSRLPSTCSKKSATAKAGDGSVCVFVIGGSPTPKASCRDLFSFCWHNFWLVLLWMCYGNHSFLFRIFRTLIGKKNYGVRLYVWHFSRFHVYNPENKKFTFNSGALHYLTNRAKPLDEILYTMKPLGYLQNKLSTGGQSGVWFQPYARFLCSTTLERYY